MADGQSRDPLVQQMHVGSRGSAVVAGSVGNVNVYLQPSSDIAFLDPYATVPPLPPGFIPRPDVIAPIIHSLSTSGTVAITAVEGMGGIGKTVVANLLCHDAGIRETFRDGILWFTMGKQPSLTREALIREMALHLNQEFKIYSEAAYRSLLKGKSVLVVVDDVWTLDAIEPFLLDTGSSRLLYTTRNLEIATSIAAINHNVDLLDDAQARRLLAQRSGQESESLPEPEATDILLECKGLVLGVAMISAALKNKPVSDWARIARNLRKARLRDVGTQVANYAYRTLWASIAASIEELSLEDKERYLKLAILVENIPYSAVLLQQIWGGDLDDTEAAMNRFVDHSLASRDAGGHIRVHDFQLDFVRGEYPYSSALMLAHSALRRSLHVVLTDPKQFASQMSGRLVPHRAEPGIRELLESLAANISRTSLWPIWPSLESAGSPTRRLFEGHTGPILAIALSADGRRAVSGSLDHTLRVWDLDGDTAPRILEGHRGPVTSVAITADGKSAVSGSYDNSLRVWDLDGDTPPRVLEAHTDRVNAVWLSTDGNRAASSSDDKTLRLWDLTGQPSPRIVEAVTGLIGTAVALSADGKRAVFGSGDNTLRVWDLDSHIAPRTIESHTAWIAAVALSADGKRAVTGSRHNSLQVWDLDVQMPSRVLEGRATSFCSNCGKFRWKTRRLLLLGPHLKCMGPRRSHATARP
jgi:NB-ARC domain/WD domain, G-beta repeat